ncbi:MAG: ligase-associated DNA damage response exonuclease [Betaproteobacteria bacterium]|nr:ligase-associated DNA damage response exonuclease [Betaproteobacteria bacterium]
MPLLEHTACGLYCAAGDFHIDPWRPVDRAVITHAHADHARPGHARYLATPHAEGVLRNRLGAEVNLECVRYGEVRELNGVRVSLHPAGHVLGSAQVRVEHRGEVWVVSGDYKLDPDPTCVPFEPVRCHTFVTESTFGLPVYRWEDPSRIFATVNAWWQRNADAGRASVLFGYAFGKAQRLLAGVDAGIGPIFVHGAVEALNRVYREAGIDLPATQMVSEVERKFDYSRALIVAPPSAQGTPWLKRFGDYADGFASGWMAIRGAKKQRNVDLGLVLSDHADWPSLIRAIEATGAANIRVTHGSVPVMVRYLQERGLNAEALDTEFEGEGGAVS